MKRAISPASNGLREYLLVHLPLILMLVMDILLVAAWWVEHHFVQAVDGEMMKSLAQKADLAASAIKDRLLSGNTESAIEFCRAFDNRIFRITLISPQGVVLADTNPSHLAFDNHSDRSEFKAAQSGTIGFARRYSETLKERMIYYAVPVQMPHGLYVVRFAKEDFPYMEIFPWITGGIVLLFAISTGLLAWLQLYLLRRIYRPLVEVGRCAGDIFEGEIETRIPIPESGPVRPLAEMLSKMTEQLKKQLFEMKKLESFRSEFIANVSHELKTPMTCILGAVETIQEERDLPAEQYEKLMKMLDEQAGRLNALIRRQRREFLQVDLQDILESGMQTLQQEAIQHGMTIRITHAEPVSAAGDAQLLEQALSNLIHNAIKYSGSPDIELSLSREEGNAVISVTDHGCGIPEENQPRIFERFYRVHKERSRALGGTGLGLAIVKHIAQLHNGKAELHSVPGKGCCFRIVIPVSCS